MKLVLVAALALAAASASAKCYSYSGGNATDTFDEGNVGLCTWYKDESCCNYSKAAEEAQRRSWDDPACEVSDGCQEILLLLECTTCSPNTADFIKIENGVKVKVTVCKSFVDRVYDSCSGDKDEYNDIGSGSTVTKNCKLIKDDFKDGTEYFERNNGATYEVVIADDNTNCFNPASSLVSSTAVVAAARSAAVVAVSGLSVVALL